jgi:hypothetical protein
MKKQYITPTTLDATLADNDSYGRYETIMAGQANAAGSKRLILATDVLITGTASFFKVVKNGNVVDVSTDLETAKKIYNTTR